MSGKTTNSTSTTVIVFGLCAAIGFGAVYAMVGGSDNISEPKPARKVDVGAATAGTGSQVSKAAVLPSQPSGGAPTAGSLQNEAPAAAVAGSEMPQTIAAQFKGADGKPLNRGAMTTFVFKKQAVAPRKMPTFNGPDGKAMSLADLKGKVILLNLWATWCGPCRKEMPHLNALQKELGSDQFEVVALSVDRGSPDKTKKFLAEVGATSLQFYHDPTAQAGFSLMAIGMPSTLLLDREGREIGRLVGPADWHSQEAKDLVNAAIAVN